MYALPKNRQKQIFDQTGIRLQLLRNVMLILLTGLFFGKRCYAQERLALQCDRYVHLAGDTLWWKASLFSDMHSNAHSNLHVELRATDGRLLSYELFPVIYGQSVGQLVLPDTLLHGVYWLRLYTGGNRNGTAGISLVVPITIYQEGDQKMTFMENSAKQILTQSSSLITLVPDTLNGDSGGYNAWRIDISDTMVYHFSCSVTDASLPLSAPVPAVDSVTVGVPNSVYLSWTGKAVKPGTKKDIKGNALMTMLVKDSTFQLSRLLPLSVDGAFRLSGLFFFGKAELYYQINKAGAGAKDVTLTLDSMPLPPFTVPTGWVSRDTLLNRTIAMPVVIQGQQQSLRIKGRELKEVKIKGWRNPRKALDSVYTTGMFSEPALYAFDLRNEKYDFGLGGYLQMHLSTQGGYSASDPPTYPRHPLLFYVNEELKTWDQISDMSISDIAYIKAMESDFIGNDPFTKFVTGVGGFSLSDSGQTLKVASQPTPMIVMIYTRKGKDIKKVQGLNQLTLTGYTPIARFTPGANGSTLLWAPLIDANHIRLRFYNDMPAKHFRLTLHGISDSGREIYYTTVIPKIK